MGLQFLSTEVFQPEFPLFVGQIPGVSDAIMAVLCTITEFFLN